MDRFVTNTPKEWIRAYVDEPVIAPLSKELREAGHAVGYLGTPGPDLLDIRAWEDHLDFAVASERDPVALRDLRFNSRRHLRDGFLHATNRSIDDVLADAGQNEETLDAAPQLPTIINYDVYANPVKPQHEQFDARGSLWSGIRNFCRAAAHEKIPALLLIITTGLRGKTTLYDNALKSVFEEISDYSIQIPRITRASLLTAEMPKKFQICIPYWLARHSATSEGYTVEIADSLDYIGTGNVKMVHLVLKFRRRADDSQPQEQALLRLVNFPHQSLEERDARFELIPAEYPIIRPRGNRAHGE